MAQTSSVTREPSMEEILASIRRIIEDSDVSKQVSAELAGAPVAQPRPEMFNTVHEELEEKRGEVAPFRRPVSKDPEPDNAASTVAQQSPFAMKAVLRGTIDEAPKMQKAEAKPTVDTVNPEVHKHNVEQVRVATVNPPVPPIVQAVPAAPVIPESGADLKAAKASEALLLHVAEKRVVAMNSEVTKQEGAPVTEPASSKPLISQAAEEQVSASFGSLSQALLEEQKRLLNDKMEAMLRPMLQQWLDTNLPPLVERLVREEIERVVRRG